MPTKKSAAKVVDEDAFHDNIEHPAVSSALVDLQNDYIVLAKKIDFFKNNIEISEKILNDENSDYEGLFDTQEEGGYVDMRVRELDILKSRLSNFQTVVTQLESMNDRATTLQELIKKYGDEQFEDVDSHDGEYEIVDKDDLFTPSDDDATEDDVAAVGTEETFDQDR